MKALYHDGQFIKFIKDRIPAAKPKVVEVLDVQEDSEPPVTDSQVAESSWVRVNGKHRKQYTTREKTTEELSKESDSASDRTDRSQVKAMLALLDQRAATPSQMQRILARLVRDRI